RGVLALEQGRYAEAVNHLQRAVLHWPRRYHAHTLRSKAYWLRGDRGRALDAFDYAVSLAEKDGEAGAVQEMVRPLLYRTRANLNRSLGDGAAALADL